MAFNMYIYIYIVYKYVYLIFFHICYFFFLFFICWYCRGNKQLCLKYKNNKNTKNIICIYIHIKNHIKHHIRI